MKTSIFNDFQIDFCPKTHQEVSKAFHQLRACDQSKQPQENIVVLE
jgi:hypothetical protein